MFVCATQIVKMRLQLFFYQSCKRKACKMGLNFTANSFVFGHINRENLSRNFFANLGGGELPKCVWISQQTVSFLDAQIVELRPELSVKLAGRELPKCVWISRQTASLLDAQIVELRHNIFFKTCKQRTSRMRLNFMANSLVFGRTNCGIAPTTFSVKLARRELSKSVWTPRQTASFLDASIGKMRPELFL